MEGFWQLIAAHVVADFMLQSDRMARDKAWGDPAALAAHFFIHLAAMVVLGHAFASLAAIVAWLSIALIHALLDWAKSKVLDPEAPPRVDFFAFLIDQALHLFIIVFIWTRADFRSNEAILALYRFVLGDDEGRRWGEALFRLLSQSTELWITLGVGLFTVFAGAVLVRKALDLFAHPDVAAAANDATAEIAATEAPIEAPAKTSPQAPSLRDPADPASAGPPPISGVIPDVGSAWEGGRAPAVRGNVSADPSAASRDQKVGRAIGMLERTLVYALLLQGALSAIGLMLAAKSIARFRELDDRSFAEYYLVGTFLSLLIAFAGFGLVQWLTGPDTFPVWRRM